MTGARLALRLLLVPLALLGHETGRRLLAALGLAAACVGLISLAFQSAEPTQPDAGQGTTMLVSPAEQATTRAPARPDRAVQPAPPPVPPRPATRDAGSPEQAARAWYATRRHLPVDRVRVLQREQLDSGRVRVLVLAEAANGRLDTAQVTVRRTTTGWKAQP
jgi:hypothetical protein